MCVCVHVHDMCAWYTICICFAYTNTHAQLYAHPNQIYTLTLAEQIFQGLRICDGRRSKPPVCILEILVNFETS